MAVSSEGAKLFCALACSDDAVDPDDHECSVCHARFTEDTMFCPRCGAGFTGRENNDDEFDFEMDELDTWDEEDEM